jgi:hypothetical protein
MDTSCALNFLGEDQEVADDVVDVVAAAMSGSITLAVTERAFEEVSRAQPSDRREHRLAQLRGFGRLELPIHRLKDRDQLAAKLHAAIFPDALPGSRTNEHNERDSHQLATHHLLGRDVFVTLDRKLLTRASAAVAHGVTVLSPKKLLERLQSDREQGRLPRPPTIAVRDAVHPADDAAIREVLSPLGDDYPDFSGWLTGALVKAAEGRVGVRVGLVGERIGAVALTSRKDPRVVKLSAFYVSQWAQGAGLGQHLLWSEIRNWATAEIEKAYVTVSSRHSGLIDFFGAFGFLIEGVSPRRYQQDTAELVMGKHLIRQVVDDDALGEFAADVAARVFGTPVSLPHGDGRWALAPREARPALVWDGSGADLRLVAFDRGGAEVRGWELLQLETIFHPARFAVTGRRALIVPIRQQWADAMLEYPGQQRSLLAADPSDKLVLRADNAYYCTPTAQSQARAGTPILFHVSGGIGLVGEGRIVEAVIDVPEELFARFGGMGVYGIKEIRQHIRRNGPNAGRAMALQFSLYVPFERTITRGELWAEVGRKLQLQTITPIPGEEFERLRRMGGLTW